VLAKLCRTPTTSARHVPMPDQDIQLTQVASSWDRPTYMSPKRHAPEPVGQKKKKKKAAPNIWSLRVPVSTNAPRAGDCFGGDTVSDTLALPYSRPDPYWGPALPCGHATTIRRAVAGAAGSNRKQRWEGPDCPPPLREIDERWEAPESRWRLGRPVGPPRRAPPRCAGGTRLFAPGGAGGPLQSPWNLP